MTAKLILVVRRRADLTHEQFKHRYEAGHVPLVRSVLPKLRRYVRNYLSPLPGAPAPEFDCITEFWFDSVEDMNETRAWVHSEAGQVLARDEAEFMDRASMRGFFADETPEPTHAKA